MIPLKYSLNYRELCIIEDCLQFMVPQTFREGYSESGHIELEALLKRFKGFLAANH